MRTIITLLFLVVCSYCSFAQTPKATAPCTYDGRIDSIYSSAGITKTLISKGAYSISVLLVSDIYPCTGNIDIQIEGVTVGSVSGVDGGLSGSTQYMIPLESFPLFTFRPGVYQLQYIFTPVGALSVDSITIIDPAGVQEIDDYSGIDIFPLPANNFIHIDVTQFSGSIDNIQLTDMNGHKVKSMQPARGNKEINLSVANLPSGMYFIDLQTESGVLKRKIVVTH